MDYKSTSLLKYYLLLEFINFQGMLPLFILIAQIDMFPYHCLKDENFNMFHALFSGLIISCLGQEISPINTTEYLSLSNSGK